MSVHRWDPSGDAWQPVPEGPRDLSKLTREQMRIETREFMRTHEWDVVEERWVDKRTPKARKR